LNKRIKNKNSYLIGVISDTHGYLAPDLIHGLKSADMIIHAGDIDMPEVLVRLKEIAPVFAVRGNMDRGEWAKALNPFEIVNIGEIMFYVVHEIHKLDISPESADIKAVISGHTHVPSIKNKQGVLFINPGSTSLPRYWSKPSMAMIRINKNEIKDAKIISLKAF
jgi:putative phosphoesterase